MEIFGWGRKNTMDVDGDGRAYTSAKSYTEDHKAADEGCAYTMDIDGITVGADGNRLFTLKNTHSTKNLVVTRIHLVPNQSSDDQELEVYVGGTFSYLANGTEVTPTNLISGMVAGAQGSFYVSDGAATSMTTVTAGLVAGRFAMITKGAVYECRKQSNWIIPPDQCFYASTTKDGKFRGFISLYYHASH